MKVASGFIVNNVLLFICLINSGHSVQAITKRNWGRTQEIQLIRNSSSENNYCDGNRIVEYKWIVGDISVGMVNINYKVRQRGRVAALLQIYSDKLNDTK